MATMREELTILRDSYVAENFPETSKYWGGRTIGHRDSPYASWESNYAFTNPITKSGKKANYFKFLEKAISGATPKDAKECISSATDRSHIYNSGLVEKSNGVWTLTSYGKEYMAIVNQHRGK